MIYSQEVENMCPVAQGVNHGAAPIPEEAKWVKSKEVKDISGLTHGVGWCAPQQGACKLPLNVKEGIIQEALVETIGCSGMTHSAAMAAEITILVAKKEQMLRRKNVEQTSQTEFEEDGQSKLFLEREIEKTPSEQLFQILSGMENALRPEKKAEWEMVYQERLISLFENPYLSQLQGKTMDGYVAYAIEKMGDKQQKLEQLRRITEGIAENNEQKIRMGLREYYLSYADAFVERWEKKAEETEK